MKYTFSSTATVSICTEVEADTLDEALDLARQQPMQTFCHQCSSGSVEEFWSCEELDGEPQDLLSISVDDEEIDLEEFARAAKVWRHG